MLRTGFVGLWVLATLLPGCTSPRPAPAAETKAAAHDIVADAGTSDDVDASAAGVVADVAADAADDSPADTPIGTDVAAETVDVTSQDVPPTPDEATDPDQVAVDASLPDVVPDSAIDSTPDPGQELAPDTKSDPEATPTDAIAAPDAGPSCVDGVLGGSGVDSQFHAESCEGGIPCACPEFPYPEGSKCCPNCYLVCDYPNCCGQMNQYHCKYGNWKVNSWYGCFP